MGRKARRISELEGQLARLAESLRWSNERAEQWHRLYNAELKRATPRKVRKGW